MRVARGTNASTRRLPAALLLLLLVFAQWSSFAHLVLVPHVLCVEHGEFIEAANVGRNDRETAPAGATSSQAAAAKSAFTPGGSLDAAHDHEHCCLAAHYRRWMPLPEHDVPFWALEISSHEEVDRGTADIRSWIISLLHLAPKTSPPPLVARGGEVLEA